jgi:hypothetical protein
MALYQTSGVSFRLAARPEPELRLWAVEGFAGGIQPWWHYVNAYHEDRRMYATPLALAAWYAEHQEFLHPRQPIATVGILYSQRNADFFGRDDGDLLVGLPERGFTQALTRARVPYLLVHADDLERDAAGLRTLVLPNLGVLTDAQAAAVRAFVARGGGLVATGAASLLDSWGDARPDLALAEVLGVRLPKDHPLRDEGARHRWAAETSHTYLRLVPERRSVVAGPHAPDEPTAPGPRHPTLAGFDETDLLPYGGSCGLVDVDPSARVLLTFVPPRPAFPPEAVWSRQTRTEIPGLVVRERPGSGRVAYLAADLDRRYARDNFPDHGDLLANLVRWTAGDDIPLKVEGTGLVDCHLYRQPGRLILHLVNLTNGSASRGPIDELVAVGPLKVAVRLPEDVAERVVRLLVSGGAPTVDVRGRWAAFRVERVLDHEVAVIGRGANDRRS